MSKLSKSIEDYSSGVGDLRKEIGGGLGLAVGAALVVLAVVLILGVAVLVHLFGGLIVLLAWNLGVVNVVAASGGSVATIGYLTAVGVSIALTFLRGIFQRGAAE